MHVIILTFQVKFYISIYIAYMSHNLYFFLITMTFYHDFISQCQLNILKQFWLFPHKYEFLSQNLNNWIVIIPAFFSQSQLFVIFKFNFFRGTLWRQNYGSHAYWFLSVLLLKQIKNLACLWERNNICIMGWRVETIVRYLHIFLPSFFRDD